MDEEQSERGPGEAAGADEPQDGRSAPEQPDAAAPDTPAAAPVQHNRVNQYFYGALDAPGAHFGIGVGDFANARRRAVGRLDAGEADALLAPYVEPRCFEEAARALGQEGVVVLVGPPGIGKRSAAVALVAKAAEGTEYVVLSPGRSLEDLADGRRMAFEKGIGYVLIDRMHEAASGTADFDWRRVRDAVRDADAHLVITTVHPVEGDAPGSVRHVPWQLPDLAAVLRVRLLRARCAADTVERAVAGLPGGCGVAEVAEAAGRIARGADPDEVWQEYGSGAAEPVREWFAAGREPREWAEVTALSFVTGAGYRDFETCQERLEEWVAPTFPVLANDEETAAAHRRDADRRLSLGRNTLVAVEERKDGALTRGALVFAHPQYRPWVLRELWAKRSTAYWNGVRDWLTELVGAQPGLGVQLSVASGLALLTRPAFDEVAENYLHPWAGGVAGPAGQSTATLVLQCMCLDEGLAATALAVGRDWARSPEPALRSTAAAAFSGALGVRFPTDAVNVLLRLTGRSEEAMLALAGLVALLLECGEDTGAVLRPLAYRLRALRTTLTGHHKETALDTLQTLLGARDSTTGRLVGASLLVGAPGQSDRVAELWAGALENRPRRGWALRVLHATLRDLTAVTTEPDPVAERFGRSLGAALTPRERQHLVTALRMSAARSAPAAAALTDIFLTAVLSTED
ncbi:hypothetical protein ACH4VX_16495 [Streptomyces sp. NPDC020731]|uniref:nSTAND3 domain-containing NTPase n=1 Tax=Streptomyces sp. NPDC020731 TaxID=3365085 RepID=UPI0037AABA4E